MFLQSLADRHLLHQLLWPCSTLGPAQPCHFLQYTIICPLWEWQSVLDDTYANFSSSSPAASASAVPVCLAAPPAPWTPCQGQGQDTAMPCLAFPLAIHDVPPILTPDRPGLPGNGELPASSTLVIGCNVLSVHSQ